MLAYVVEEINRYADQVLETQTVTRKSLLLEWKPTNIDEMSKFFGIILTMGMVNMPSSDCYWSKKKIYAYDFVRSNNAISRFFLLLRILHFNDNETVVHKNRLHKVEPIPEMLSNNFKSVYSPGEQLVVDESLVPFRGKIIFRQYIPGKSHKYGIKLYKLCSVNGYAWNLQGYTGNLSNEPEHNHPESIVLKLARPLLRNGATIYADNFYSSVPLAEKLITVEQCAKTGNYYLEM